MKAKIKETGEIIHVDPQIFGDTCSDIFFCCREWYGIFSKYELDFNYNGTIETDNTQVIINLQKENEQLKERLNELTMHATCYMSEIHFGKRINWEERRYQIAKDIYTGCLLMDFDGFNEEGLAQDCIAKDCIAKADKLIKQLINTKMPDCAGEQGDE